jgi:hypothetical protein
LVAKALVSDRFALDAFPILSQLPAVEQVAAANPRLLCARGKALQTFLRQAVSEVIAAAGDTDDVAVGRLVEYLRWRYQEGVSVRAIAQRWGCSTVQVWRSTGRRALDLVTVRFLEQVRAASENPVGSAPLALVGSRAGLR